MCCLRCGVVVTTVTVSLYPQDKAAQLHAQLHGSTFHMKLAKEAMKKVREAEQAAATKANELPAPGLSSFLLLQWVVSQKAFHVHMGCRKA